jgi:hypothetical protein
MGDYYNRFDNPDRFQRRKLLPLLSLGNVTSIAHRNNHDK